MSTKPQIIKTTDIRSNLLDILNTVYYTKNDVIIIKGKRPLAKITPLDETDLKLLDHLNKK